jgi:hypothetical protein
MNSHRFPCEIYEFSFPFVIYVTENVYLRVIYTTYTVNSHGPRAQCGLSSTTTSIYFNGFTLVYQVIKAPNWGQYVGCDCGSIQTRSGKL